MPNPTTDNLQDTEVCDHFRGTIGTGDFLVAMQATMEQALTSRFSASATLDLTSKKATGRYIIVRAAASSQLLKCTSLPQKETISISSTSRNSRKSSPVMNLRSMASSGSEFSPQGTTKLAVLLEVEG